MKRTLLLLLVALTACSSTELPEPRSERPGIQQRRSALEYGFRSEGSAVRATNRDQGYRIGLTREGARLSEPGEGWSFTLSTLGLSAAPRLVGDRVEYERDDLVEWFTNGPEGLRQGWTVGVGGDEVVIDVAVRGASAQVARDGRSAALRAAGATFSYRDLRSWDADGAPLEARLEEGPAGIRIRAVTSGAAWPVTIDPVVTAVYWTVTGSTANHLLGAAVHGTGDVNADGFEDVLVGIPGSGAGGAVALYLGGVGGPGTTPAWSAAASAGCDFGGELGRLGDVNGDGFDDIVVADDCAQVIAAGDGQVHVWYGQQNISALPSLAQWTYTVGTAGASTGSSVAGAGDVDGDGYADLLIGATGYGTGGAALLFLGDATGLGSAPIVTLAEPQSGAFSGSAVAGVGDVNGDGLSDVIVGAMEYDAPIAGTSAGRVQLFFGTGSTPPLSTTADWTGYGGTEYDRLGSAVAGLGDVDGDGYPDFAAGAPTSDVANEQSVGRVLVWTTPGGSPVLSPLELLGDIAQDTWGDELAGVGDVNGDGYADLGVGGPGGDRFAVYLGGSTGVETAPSFNEVGTADSGAGAIAAAGDVDGDGIGDVIVGAAFDLANDAGSASIYRGLRAGPLEIFGQIVDGSAAGARLGADVAWIGDVNGDGYADVLAGAPRWSNGESDEGAAFIYLGTETGIDKTAPAWSAESNTGGAKFGTSVSGAGDVNGDGYADWLVGAPDFGALALSGIGRVSLYYGSANIAGTTAAWQVSSSTPNARMGSDVGGGGDINGDGYADLVVGARLYSSGQAQEGAVYVWFGGAGGPATVADWSTQSNVGGAQLGESVAFLGDVNGDGYGDIGAGAPEYDDGSFADAGAAFVWLGSASGPATSASWSFGAWQVNGFGAFGDAIAGAGDVNGDGYDDVIVGAPQSIQFTTNEGRASLFLGQPSAVGLPVTPDWEMFGGGDSALAGTSVAGGNLNGDGYSDVVVGSPGWDGSGRVTVFPGRYFGPGLADIFDRVGTQSGEGLGSAVAAGDTDGDGVDDLIAGASLWDVTTNGNQGKFGVFPGNAGDGGGRHPRPPALRLTSSGVLPLAPWGRGSSPSDVEVVATQARGPWGRIDVAIEVEVKALGVPFDGAGTVQSPWVDVGTSGAALSALVSNLTPNTALHWRGRPRYRPSEALHQRWGPWVVGGLPGQGQGVHFRSGCAGDNDADGVCDVDDPDDDNDGSLDVDDCDDFDPAVYPNAPESCDGVDSDCNGSLVDTYADFDGDGDPDCNDTDDDDDGVDDGSDCAPFDPAAYPGNVEACDGVDNDCDGVVPTDESDADGDTVAPCGGDCDDTLDTVYPGAPEALDCLDNDCDAAVPASEEADTDLDGSRACDDCDDTDPAVQPGAPELCDGVDSNCDGVFDTDGLFTGEQDDDGDGFSECEGDCDDGQDTQYPGAPETGDADEDLNCDGVFGQGDDADGDGSSITDPEPDCDDGDPDRFPGNVEACDGVDNDCDGLTLSETADADEDGFFACADCNEADPAIPSTDTEALELCDGWNSDCDPGGFPDPDTEDYDVDRDGVAACEGDCDDDDPSRAPGTPEVCGDGIDDDCDGEVDEDEDADEDGVSTCQGDCADDDAAVFPGAVEICDGLDQDCDGDVDEDFDGDGDGAPDCGDSPDCDDADPTVHPGAPEDCTDGIDNDCDPSTLPFVDLDGDGLAPCPGGDCDDTSDAVSPAHDEVCDGIDNDCDGAVDEDLDLDNDGLTWCTGDCAEGDPGVRAGLAEVCADGIDQDCDQRVDDGCETEGPVPLDIVFPAGCVCDATAPAGVPGVFALLSLLVAAIPRRRP